MNPEAIMAFYWWALANGCPHTAAAMVKLMREAQGLC